MKAFFHASDFEELFGSVEQSRHNRELAARIANAKLKEWLDNSRTLYASKDTEWQWTEYQYNSDTHTAKLVCIEEIKKECVMHEPAEITVDVEPYTDLITFNYSANSKCKHCGVELVADWKVK